MQNILLSDVGVLFGYALPNILGASKIYKGEEQNGLLF